MYWNNYHKFGSLLPTKKTICINKHSLLFVRLMIPELWKRMSPQSITIANSKFVSILYLHKNKELCIRKQDKLLCHKVLIMFYLLVLNSKDAVSTDTAKTTYSGTRVKNNLHWAYIFMHHKYTQNLYILKWCFKHQYLNGTTMNNQKGNCIFRKYTQNTTKYFLKSLKSYE